MSDFITAHTALVQDCLTDLWTLYLTFIGILLSIITLLYSFIFSKKEDLKLISEYIKIHGIGPIINQKKDFAISYICRLVRINRYCFGLLIFSILIDIICWTVMRLSTNANITFWIFIIILGLTVIMCGFLIFIGSKLIKQYISDTKI